METKRRKKAPRNRETVYLSDAALQALERLKARYPERIYSDFLNGAIIYMESHAQLDLTADCQPVNPYKYKDVLIEILATEGGAANEEVPDQALQKGPPKSSYRL